MAKEQSAAEKIKRNSIIFIREVVSYMEKPHFDIEKLRGILWGKHQLVAKHLGIRHELLLRKLKTGDFTIDDLEKIGQALGRDVAAFVSAGEES
jgi:hypothetical protein